MGKPYEVEDFREIFLNEHDRSTLTLEELRSMLSVVVPMGHHNSEEFANLFDQVASRKPNGSKAVNFPEFLLFIRRCLDRDLCHINECAERSRRRKSTDSASPRRISHQEGL